MIPTTRTWFDEVSSRGHRLLRWIQSPYREGLYTQRDDMPQCLRLSHQRRDFTMHVTISHEFRAGKGEARLKKMITTHDNYQLITTLLTNVTRKDNITNAHKVGWHQTQKDNVNNSSESSVGTARRQITPSARFDTDDVTFYMYIYFDLDTHKVHV